VFAKLAVAALQAVPTLRCRAAAARREQEIRGVALTWEPVMEKEAVDAR
jgi:hypothetical protein